MFLNLENKVSFCQSWEAVLTFFESYFFYLILFLKQEIGVRGYFGAFFFLFISIFVFYYIYGLVFLGFLDVNECIILGIVFEIF